LMFGFDGIRINDDVRHLIDGLKVGGLILFRRNIDAPEQVTDLCRSVQQFAADCGQPPLFIAVDQEGGEVARLRKPFTLFPGNPKMTGTADAVEFAETTASELTGIGINMNMAPVLDIAPEGMDSVMINRAFGADPRWVSTLGTTVIRELQQRNIMAVGKHFPGIGRTTLDSHLDLPELDIDPDVMEKADLLPFRAAIDSGVSAMMMSHVRYGKIDSQWPASLSGALAGRLLRGKMGFDGVVMTDDLDMGAIANHYDMETVITRVVEADIDIAMICHRSRKMETAFEVLLNRARTSGAEKDKMMGSVKRIMRLKEKYLR